MNIVYWGQSSLTERIAAVGQELAAAGHDVTVTLSKGTAPSAQNVNGIRLRRWPSFDPQRPGGWLYALLGLLTVLRQQPQVVHMHGWRAAALVRLAIILSPKTTYVWTVDSTPANHPRLVRIVARQAAAVIDGLTAPSRFIQSELLNRFGVRAQYVPDGYAPSTLKPIAPSHWRLRRGAYTLLVGTTPAEKRAAGKQAKYLEKLAGTERAQRSLMASAKTVVLGSTATSQQAFWAMETGKSIVAAPTPALSEVLGVTARFARVSRPKDLREAMRARGMGAKAARRAERHFTWERVADDYITVYNHYVARPVPLDSARLEWWNGRHASFRS